MMSGDQVAFLQPVTSFWPLYTSVVFVSAILSFSGKLLHAIRISPGVHLFLACLYRSCPAAVGLQLCLIELPEFSLEPGGGGV